ncbi:MAG: radical SAM protein [Chloroflexota bacterium]
MLPRLSPHVHIEIVADRDHQNIFFVLDSDKPSWVFVNQDGLEILRLCNGTNTVEGISRAVLEAHGKLDYEECLQVVSSFIDSMERSRMLSDRPDGDLSANEFRGLALEITGRCNLRCVHCYLAAGEPAEGELTIEEIKEVLRSAGDLGGVSVAIGGGEPLLRGDCLQVIEYALSQGLLVSLGTNGTLIDVDVAKALSEMGIKVQVSLDGATAQTHDRIRGIGSFERTVKGVDHLIEAGMAKDVVIAFTPMRPNVHEVPEVVDFARGRGIPVVQFPPLTSSGRAKARWQELKLTKSEMLWFWDFVSRKAADLKGSMDLLADCFSIDIHRAGIPYRCSIGTQYRIAPDGTAYPCQCFHYGSEFALGNVKEKSLEAIVRGQRVREIKETCFQRPLRIAECRECRWRNFCGAGCMGNAFESTGTILSAESCEVRKRWVERLFEAKVSEVSA